MKGKVILGVISFATVLFLASMPAALAKPGEGIKIGNLTLSPFADISVHWDSNVFLTDQDETDDFFLDAVPGIAFVNKTEKLILSGRGWGQFRRYLDQTSLDTDSWGEKLGAVWGEEDRLTLAISEKYIELTDYEIEPRAVDTLNLTSQNLMLAEDRTERERRNLFDIGPVAEYHVSEKFQVDVGYSYSSVEYKTNNLFDWHENRGQLEFRQKVTDKTSVLLNGQYSEQTSDGFTNDSTYYIVRGGVLYEATKKTAFRATAGLESYDFGNTTPSGEDLNTDILSYDFAATWQATEKILVEAMAKNGIQPAAQYLANTKEITLASVGASYDITKSWILSLAGSWRYDDYIGKVTDPDTGLLTDKNRRLYGGRLRLDYKPSVKFFDLYAETTYEDSRTNIQDDYGNYEQWRIALGLALRY
jgi:hypothetical protein